jgi:ABC-type amino acid transport substrate-binding protein/serine phosphatase RsbU (regulator of sigma subunit)
MRKVLIVLLLTATATHAQQNKIDFTLDEQAWINEHPIVYYGYDPAWKPLEFAEEGKHVGISRDYCELLSERIGFVLRPHPEANDWTHAMELLEANELSVLPCLAENEERAKKMNFTASYLDYSFVIVTDKDGDFIGSVEDLDGRTVAVPEGYAITHLLKEEPYEIKFIYTKDVEQSLMEVTAGNAEATVANLAVISHFLNYSGYENLKISAPTSYPKLEAKFGVSKSEPILVDILNKGLATITAKEKNDIIQNWVSVQYDYGVNMKRVWTIAGVSLGVIGLVFGFIVYWNRKLKKEVFRRKEAEEGLQESYEEISMQKVLIEQKSEEVTDSIKYAKRLQEAIMPSLNDINACFPSNFVFYKPKDIVAGDFYWMEKVEGEIADSIFIAAADCTGHGVPGAMVSVVCSNALNRSVLEHGLLDPGEILDKTTDLVIERFSKSDDEVKDGMDIGLSKVQFLKNGNANIEFAGAHNHLWVISKRTDLGIETNPTAAEGSSFILHEIKASKQPVGQYFKRVPFQTTKLNLEKGERFYIASDGFADQFGGQDGKKFKNKAFKHLLLSTVELGISEQKDKLEEIFEQWKSDFEQLDDVCVIGIEI